MLVESLDQEGRGVAHVDGKVIFIEGALPGEVVEFASYQRKPNYEFAEATRIVRRVGLARRSPLPLFRRLRRLQHAAPGAACAGGGEAARPRGQSGSYRQGDSPRPCFPRSMARPGGTATARASRRATSRKKGALVGFRERRSSFVADMKTCEVVPARISALLRPLRQLIASLSIRERLPQVELAIGDAVDVLVLRVLEPPDARRPGQAAGSSPYRIGCNCSCSPRVRIRSIPSFRWMRRRCSTGFPIST